VVTPEGCLASNSHIHSSFLFFFATTDHDVVWTRRSRRYRWGKPFTSVSESHLALILVPYSQFADGHSYSKNKMDEIVRSGALDKLPPKQKESHPHVKREDVELIVSRETTAIGNGELMVIGESRCTSWRYQNRRRKKRCTKLEETCRKL